jgi:hypothetical protein
MYRDQEMVKKAFKVGAMGYILKDYAVNEILECIEKMNKEVGGIHSIIGDAEFGNKIITNYCDENNIRLNASVSKTEHISNGSKLGIVDRICRTLRELMNRYYEVTGHKKDNLKEVLQTAVETYNDNEHRTIKTTPNKAFNNNNLLITLIKNIPNNFIDGEENDDVCGNMLIQFYALDTINIEESIINEKNYNILYGGNNLKNYLKYKKCLNKLCNC